MSQPMKVSCHYCADRMVPTPSQARRNRSFQCKLCKRKYDAEWRKRRRANGLRASGPAPKTPERRAWQAVYNRTEKKRQYNRAYNRKYSHDPETLVRRRARRRARTALANGILVRGSCEDCGAARTDAHHDDYSKPLNVRWLCRTHHLPAHYAAAEAQDKEPDDE